MGKLWVFPLFLLFVSALIMQSYAISSESGSQLDLIGDNATLTFVNGSVVQVINGSETEFEVEGYEVSAGFDMETGFIAFGIAMIAIGIVAGIQVVGSGLSDVSVKIIYKSVGFFGVWGLLSAFALGGFMAIPLSFGWLVYFSMTLVYGVGVFSEV